MTSLELSDSRTPVIIHLRVVVLKLLASTPRLRHLLDIQLLEPSSQALSVGIHCPWLGSVADIAGVATGPIAAQRNVLMRSISTF